MLPFSDSLPAARSQFNPSTLAVGLVPLRLWSMPVKTPSRVTVAYCALGLTAHMLTAQAVPNPAVEDSIKALEEARGQALLRGDTVAISRMTAPEFNELTRFGTIRPRAANMRDVGSGLLRLTSVRFDSLNVRLYGDVAILQGITDNTGTMGGIPFSGRIRYTRVFVRRDGRWQAVTMQHTPMQGPPSN
jgi:hypothetical protein